ncbi:high-affinity choline transporter 1-like isoform X1 [Dermacentor albipictus]|uniref:high-affinity choline transporter 1-like isoform X1 n=1 Tax=Dermacentor albipictus TaxID=60249 RepID=UPI0031FD8CBE
MVLDIIETLCITVYCIITLVVGVWAGRKLHLGARRISAPPAQKGGGHPANEGEYFLLRYFIYDRQMSLLLGVFSMTVTWVGRGLLIGAAETVYKYGIVRCQAPFGYALSLLVGGSLFASKIRSTNALTMMDPFQRRYGHVVCFMLTLPAMCGEVIWSAALLASLGSSMRVILEVNMYVAIVISAMFTFLYTALGGLYSVASTDVVHVVVIGLGLALCVPYCITNKAVGAVPLPEGDWVGSISVDHANSIIDEFATTALGGIPWQVYFKFMLACRSDFEAQLVSFLSALGCLLLACPSMIIGAVAKTTNFTAAGYTGGHVLRESEQADVLPYSLHYLVPVYAAAMGLAAIASSVFSSVDASALSAASLFARNIYFNFLRPNASSEEMAAAARMSVCLLGAVTAAMALDAQSVYIMRSLCADIIYVLLFPQLLCLFYLAELTNTYGVLAGFLVGLLTRTLCGEPLINVPVIISPPLYRTFCMVASLSCTVGVSYAYQTLFARRLLADFLGCFVVVGQDDRGRYLVRSGLGSVSEPLPSRGAAAATKADSPARTVAPDSNSKEPRPDAGTPVPPTNSTGRPGSGPRADCATPAVAAEAALSQTPRASTIVTPRGSAAVPSVVTPGPYAFLTGLAESAKQHTSRVAAMVGAYDQHQGLDSAAETISDTSKLTNVTADPEPRKTFAFTPKQPKADRSRSASSLKKGTRLRRPSSRSSSSTSTKSKSQKQKA